MKKSILVNKINGDTFGATFCKLFEIEVEIKTDGECVANCNYLKIKSNLANKKYSDIDVAIDDFQKEIMYTVERNLNMYVNCIISFYRR